MSASSPSSPNQVSLDSSQTNQILQFPWKQEIVLLIASHSSLLLPHTNHMVIIDLTVTFLKHKFLSSSEIAILVNKLHVLKQKNCKIV